MTTTAQRADEDGVVQINFSGLVITRQGYTMSGTEQYAGGITLRTTVVVDSYAFQSHAKVEVWSPTTYSWQPIVTRQGEQFQPAFTSYASRDSDAKAENCLALMEDMRREAGMILGLL